MPATPRIFGSEGCLLYSGDDADPASGKLELLLDNGSAVVEDRAALGFWEVRGLLLPDEAW